MHSYQIYKNLGELNELAADEAEAAFLDCCGSTEWAAKMTAARPFAMLEDLFASAETIWCRLTPADWLEAFAAHPRIGSSTPAPKQGKVAAKWSGSEQSGVTAAGENVKRDLAEANRLYDNKFGFIFIVCASGKSADEMLAICRARFGNSIETEMHIAAAEQRKITEIRLNKLLEK